METVLGRAVSMVFLGYLSGASMASRAGVLLPSPEPCIFAISR